MYIFVLFCLFNHLADRIEPCGGPTLGSPDLSHLCYFVTFQVPHILIFFHLKSVKSCRESWQLCCEFAFSTCFPLQGFRFILTCQLIVHPYRTLLLITRRWLRKKVFTAFNSSRQGQLRETTVGTRKGNFTFSLENISCDTLDFTYRSYTTV